MARAVLYLRQSVTRRDGKSVSLGVQEDRCRKWAESQGHVVVGVFADPDTSGSKNAPGERAGWQSLRASDFDVVVIYRLDRLARNFLQFWDTVRDLQEDGRTLASVSESLDLGTPTGKIVASVLAGVAEMEADDISQRVADARQRLIQQGRVVGGKVPWGYRAVDNPAGKGKVLEQDPGAVEWLREAVQRTREGHTVYSTALWLTERGVPTPAGRSGTWQPSTVERVLRHPVLAGMTPFNPGRVGEKTRGDDLLRDGDGLPVVDAGLAVMTVADWREMVRQLDARDSPQARSRSLCDTTSPLLSGLVYCGDPRHGEPVKMWRGTHQGREGYSCPQCHQTVTGFEDIVVDEFLREKGDDLRWRVVEVVPVAGEALLPEIEARLDELAALIRKAATREERLALQDQQAGLLDLRDEKRAEAPKVEWRQEGGDRSFAEDWEAAADDVERRRVLDDALERVVVTRGRPGRRTRDQLLARLSFQWRPTAEWHEPDETWLVEPA